MCEPVTLGLILSAVGGGTKAINQQISLKRQDKASARGIREQSELQRGADKQVNELIAEFAGETGADERAESLEGFLNTLRENQDVTGGADDPLALGGQRFAERVEGGVAKTRAAGAARAGRLATITGAGRQRLNEANRTALTATELREVENQSQAQDFITQLRIASKRPNVLVDALGSAIQGAGSVVSLGAGGLNLKSLFNKGTLIDNPVTRGLPAITGGTPPIFSPVLNA